MFACERMGAAVEPVALEDIVGWRARVKKGALPVAAFHRLDTSVALLRWPRGKGPSGLVIPTDSNVSYVCAEPVLVNDRSVFQQNMAFQKRAAFSHRGETIRVDERSYEA